MNSQDLTTMKDIGKLIRDIRKQQGVTQEELAGISGTGRRFISDVENGKNTTQTGKLLLVLKALGLNLYIFNKWELGSSKQSEQLKILKQPNEKLSNYRTINCKTMK